MINPKGKKLEKLLFGIFDEAIQGVDTYNHNGSMWLIFTDDKKWVVEYTKEQTLWYNYYFFKQEMDMVGLDCVENKNLIQKWFESKFLNKNEVEDTIQNGVKYTNRLREPFNFTVEDTIQNGVKHTKWIARLIAGTVEDTIQNGVKHTYVQPLDRGLRVEKTIQNGVKNTRRDFTMDRRHVENIIQNGVKYCEDGDWLDGDERFEDIIQNGVKHISDDDIVDYKKLEDTIQNGIKEK